MQSVLKLCVGLSLCVWFIGCRSASPGKPNDSSLVRVAIVKLVNASGNSMYDYLGDSLTDAAVSSMDKKFVYARIPEEETRDLYNELSAKGGVFSDARQRSHALAIDADLIMSGYFKTTPGKKGDSAAIVIHVFRGDQSAIVAKISRTAVISGAIFKDIEAIANELVKTMIEYRRSQLRQRGVKEDETAAAQKIKLTRESINLIPFIPPIF